MPDNIIGNLMNAAKSKAKQELINNSNSATGTSSATGTNSAASNYTGEVFIDKDNKQYTKHSILGGIVQFAQITCGAGGPWWDCVQQMGAWYQQNIHTYQTGTDGHAHGKKGWYQCPLLTGALHGEGAADDCSGFVHACLRMAGIDCKSITTTEMNKDWFTQLLEQNGFQHLTGEFTPENSQPGDIWCGKASTHTEIYAGNGKVYSWGNIHDGQNGHAGMPSSWYNMGKNPAKGPYIHCWRKIG